MIFIFLEIAYAKTTIFEKSEEYTTYKCFSTKEVYSLLPEVKLLNNYQQEAYTANRYISDDDCGFFFVTIFKDEKLKWKVTYCSQTVTFIYYPYDMKEYWMSKKNELSNEKEIN